MSEEEGGVPEPAETRQQELEGEVEGLVERIIDLVNAADPEQRHSLREYAADLLKGGTEVVVDAQAMAKPAIRDRSGNPLGISLLLLGGGLVLALPFPFMGITMIGIAALLGLWGLVLVALRR